MEGARIVKSCIDRIPWRCRVSWLESLGSLLGGVVGYTLAVFLAGWWTVRRSGDVRMITFLSLAAQLAALVGICCALRGRTPRGRLAAKLGLRRLRCRDFRMAGCGFVLLLFGTTLVTNFWQLLLERWGIAYEAEQEVLLFALDLPGPQLMIFAVLVVLVVPCSEELFFRRMVYGLLRPAGGWCALLLTALLFSAVHFFLLGLPGLFLMGVVFQLGYLRTRNLAVPVMMHSLVNLMAVLGVLFRRWCEITF